MEKFEWEIDLEKIVGKNPIEEKSYEQICKVAQFVSKGDAVICYNALSSKNSNLEMRYILKAL